MRFYVGLHQPSDAKRLSPAFISVHRLRRRKVFAPTEWIMDSGAFSTILQHGGYPHPTSEYASEIRRWAQTGTLHAAVSQDYMCEPHMLQITGRSVADHQRLTIERYDELCNHDLSGVYLMPVLQGYTRDDYLRHIDQYGDRLERNQWVGVGSVCKRNGAPEIIFRALHDIKSRRPDLRLHGFGLKTTALGCRGIREQLHSADSMAWSYAAFKHGGNQNDWREALRFRNHIAQLEADDLARQHAQESLFPP